MSEGVREPLARVLLVEVEERVPVAWAFAGFFCLLCGYFILRPLRETVAVATGTDELQYVYTATFAVMAAAVPVYGWMVARLPKRIFVIGVYAFFLSCLVGFFAMLGGPEPSAWVAQAFYVWVSVFNLFVVSLFWSVMSDRFGAEQAIRLFGIVAAGGSAGAVIGPLITGLLAPLIGPFRLTLVSAVFLTLALVCQLRLLRGATAELEDRRIGGSVWAGATELARSPYLLGIAFLVGMLTLLQTSIYFLQIDIVAAAYGDTDPTVFFALVDAATNVLSVLFQVFLVSRLLRRLGTAWTLALMPLVTAIGFVVLALSPGLLVLGVVQVLRRAGEYGIMKPSRDLLYTRVDEEARYKAKSFIDTAIYRGGDLSGAWAYHAIAAGGGLVVSTIALLGVPLAALWTGLAWRIGRDFDERG